MEKYILIPARTGSEWDSVSFALLNYSVQFMNDLLEKKKIVEGLKPHADKMTLYCDDVDFFTSQEELKDEFQPVDSESTLLIELSDDEFKNLSRPEQTIKYGQRTYTEDGITFSAFGKHTDEEYWCSISWKDISKWADEQSQTK